MSERCRGVTARRVGQEREVGLGMELQKSPTALGGWPGHPGESTPVLGKWVCSCFLPGRARWEGQETSLGRFTGLWPLPKAFSHATCCGVFPFLLAGWCCWSVFLLKQVCCYPWSSRAASPAQTLWVFLSSSWLSIGICLYWSLNSPVPGLGKLPACLHWCYIGASSSPCVLLAACNLPCLFKVENVLHLQLHLGFWNCCGPRCLNCFRLLF